MQFIREFLAEYEQEASGGGTSGGSRGGMSGRGIGGDFNHGGGCEDNVGDKGMGDIRGRSRGIGSGIGDGGDIRGGNNGIGVQNNLFSGRDLVRHELCGKLVSNLFSSKSLRERLSKKSIAGILVGLLCGPPTLRVTTSAQSVRTCILDFNNTRAPTVLTRTYIYAMKNLRVIRIGDLDMSTSFRNRCAKLLRCTGFRGVAIGKPNLIPCWGDCTFAQLSPSALSRALRASRATDILVVSSRHSGRELSMHRRDLLIFSPRVSITLDALVALV